MEQVIKESIVPDQKHGKAAETIYGVGVMFVQRIYPAFVIGRPLVGLALPVDVGLNCGPLLHRPHRPSSLHSWHCTLTPPLPLRLTVSIYSFISVLASPTSTP